MNPIKTYDLINRHTFSHKNLELQQNHQTILWINVDCGFFSKPVVNLHQNSPSGPIIASTKLRNMSGLKVSLGGGPWADVPSESWTNKQYAFYFGNTKFVWRRTHDSSLGASSLGSNDFKLIDTANEGRILAVYISSKKWFSASQVGRIDWFVDLGREPEVMSLAVILGIEEKLRRDSHSAAAGGAAGGGGGGG